MHAYVVADEYQLQQSRHATPRYRVAVPIIRDGKLRGWTGHSAWTPDRALAERWLARKLDELGELRQSTKWRSLHSRSKRSRYGGRSRSFGIRGAERAPGPAQIVPGGLPGLGKRR
jgi:hypothetical protein